MCLLTDDVFAISLPLGHVMHFEVGKRYLN